MLEAVPLLERDAVLGAVETLVRGAAQGAGGVLGITGEAGVGKTSVLAAAAAVAAGRGVRTGEGRGSAAEAGLPFGLLDQAFSSVATSRRSPLAGDPGGGAASDARAARFHATLQWLEEESADAPVILVLDDLHWADGDSLTLLEVVARRLGRLRVGVLAGLRPHPLAAIDVLHRLAGDGTAAVERLRPLSEAAAAELVRRVTGGDVSEPVAARALELCAGNPLLLEQAAQAIARGEALPEAGRVPPVDALVLSRLLAGDRQALDYARCAAVLGISFRPWLAAELAGLEPTAADGVLEGLCRGGLAAGGGGGRAEFVHPLFHQALYDGIPAPVRARLHERAFRVLAARGAPPAQCAEHALAAHLDGDSEAVAVLERAGRAALRAGAPASAARFLGGAVDLAGDAAKAELRVVLGEARLLDGDEAAAVGLCEGVLVDPAASPAERAQALGVLGRVDFRRGDYGASGARYEAALRAAEGAEPALAVEALLDLVSVAFFSGGPAAALPLAERARAASVATGTATRAIAACAHGFVGVAAGDAAGADEAAAGARDVVELGLTARAASLAWHGAAAALLERHDQASAALALAWRWSEFGDPVIRALVGATLADHLARTGHVGAALEHADADRELAAGMDVALLYVDGLRAGLLVEAGRLGEAGALVAAITATATERRDGLAMLRLRHAALRIALSSGHIGAATAEARALSQLSDLLGVREPCLVPWRRDAVAANLAAGDAGAAEAIAVDLERASAVLPCRWPAAAALACRAAIAASRGDDRAAAALAREACLAVEGAGLPIEHARLLLDLGAAERRLANTAAARDALAEAVRLAEAAGAAWTAAAALEELRVAGGRRRALRSGDDRLTAAELRVARLAAAGATNAEIAARLFLSPKTVDTHLQHVFAKLGLSSRRALIPMADRLEAEAAPADD